jgi:SNF2 family DNA or RNA helicase
MGGFEGRQVVGFVNTEEMNEKCYSITYRANADVIELPEKHHIERTHELSSPAKKAYIELKRDLCAIIASGQIITAANAMVKVTRLQQICCGHIRTEADDTNESETVQIDTSRAELLEEILEEIGAEEPVVVFCRFRTDLTVVHNAAKNLGYSSSELSGQINTLAQWQDGETQVLAVQIQSGGVGIDLTRARYAIYYSLDFSLGNYEQSLARLHRPGQTRSVTYIHLIAEGTIDRKIRRAMAQKKDAVEVILAELTHESHERGISHGHTEGV